MKSSRLMLVLTVALVMVFGGRACILNSEGTWKGTAIMADTARELGAVPLEDQGTDLSYPLWLGVYPYKELSTGRMIVSGNAPVYVQANGQRVRNWFAVELSRIVDDVLWRRLLVVGASTQELRRIPVADLGIDYPHPVWTDTYRLKELSTGRQAVRNGRPVFVHGDSSAVEEVDALTFALWSAVNWTRGWTAVSRLAAVAGALLIVGSIVRDLRGASVGRREPAMTALVGLAVGYRCLIGIGAWLLVR